MLKIIIQYSLFLHKIYPHNIRQRRRCHMRQNIVDLIVRPFQIANTVLIFAFRRHFLLPYRYRRRMRKFLYGKAAPEHKECLSVEQVDLSAHKMIQPVAYSVYLPSAKAFDGVLIQQIEILVISVQEQRLTRKPLIIFHNFAVFIFTPNYPCIAENNKIIRLRQRYFVELCF